ncbi:MAG: SEL1-like repeat protein, partial [Desulfomonile tiedjei]|nr:SEL1-like repeat protein [Desulfomonile tiedjei]
MGTLSAKSYAPNKIHSLGYCSLVAALALLLPVLCLATEDSKAIRRDRGGSATAVPEMIRADLYAVVVGVSNYKDPKIPKLRVSDKDALDFAEFLKTQKELYRNIWLTILVNEEATSGEVKKHLFYKLRKAGKNDTVILFFSGHGADDPNIPGEFFFLTYDADPEYLEATAVNLTQMKFMHRLDSKRVVLVADTCHAGGFSIQGQKSLEPALEKFISQFNQSEGKIVLTSSRTDEVSLESPDLGNSVFTHYLIKGLAGEADAARKGYVTLKEAYEYVYEKTKDATNGVQHPQLEGRLVGAFPISLNLSLGADVRFNEPSPERDQLASHRPSGATKPPAEAREPRPSDDLNELLKRAKKNDPKAQNDLGDLYFYGRGVPTDYTEAVKWYRKAADQGYARAQADLGDMYYSGKGVPKNYEQALEWYRRSAAQGYARGQADVGDLYYNGQGLPKDYGEALQWYRKAADQGYARAQQKIGDIYYHGHGVSKNYEQSVQWYQRAAD